MKTEHNETKTDLLSERIQQNERFQTIDINSWAFQRIPGNSAPLQILELCCGTGRQTEYLLRAFPNSNLSCLDVSKESIETVKSNNPDEWKRLSFYNVDLDAFFNENKHRFDIIFCSYGLYYSTDVNLLLKRIYEQLNPKGHFIVMGPYGNNNKQLFETLSQAGVQLSGQVVYSSSEFMTSTVLPFCIKLFEESHVYSAQNRITWADSSEVLSYWKSSTFYDEKCENIFRQLLEDQMKKNQVFNNDKHIMLINAIKHG
jgi:ubiquinone/menaquinone biosynthesis C-methylase UbiE